MIESGLTSAAIYWYGWPMNNQYILILLIQLSQLTQWVILKTAVTTDYWNNLYVYTSHLYIYINVIDLNIWPTSHFSLKVSYSCMPKIRSFSNGHKKKALSEKHSNTCKPFNCRAKTNFPPDSQGAQGHGNVTNRNIICWINRKPFHKQIWQPHS